MTKKQEISFDAKVRRLGEDDCWEWQARLQNNGYGQFNKVGAHRVAWVRENGPIPDGLFACHKCDNKRCCNPKHLFLGTAQDNKDDCVRKGRHARGETSGLHMHPEKAARGDRNGSRLHPEKLRRGNNHPRKLRPELWPTGKNHHWHRNPETVRRGEDHWVAKLTEEDIRKIRELRKGGEKIMAIAVQFGITDTMVSRIYHRKSWAHVL